MKVDTINKLVLLIDPKVDQCPVLVKRSSLTELEKDSEIKEFNDKLFEGKEAIRISRKDVFDVFKEKNELGFLLYVLYWGFPVNMHNIFAKVRNGKVALKSFVAILLSNPTALDNNNVPQKAGCGYALLSKLLYFSSAKFVVEGKKVPFAILDSRVTKSINCMEGIEFESLKRSLRKTDVYKRCKAYSAELFRLANGNPNEIERWEYVLWLLGG
ncbi:MAG: hypothetical protein IKN48_08335 [Bacteroidaceae bacterium]|nr:hypothetical protein [Bacteroidaceae bacterium]